MKRTIAAVAALAAASLALTACGGGSDSDSSSGSSGGPTTITVSGWSLSTTPEFQKLADAFSAKYPDYKVQVKEYDATNYNTLLTADLAAGKGPDVITQKEVKYLPTFVKGGQLADVSDLKAPDGIGGTDSYKVDGKTYALPYRMDSWVMFYNKDLFDKAGVTYPDGSWTWDDYVANLQKLKAGLPKGAYAAYLHNWQSTVQGLANAQSGADILKGDFSHLKEPYERTVGLQKDGLQVDFNTEKANQLTYQAEFGKQHAATMLMGSWYVATLISQQASGEADKFNWGFAPVPQMDSSTAGTSNTPVTFGDPTGFAVNAHADGAKKDAAEKFLQFASSEEAANMLAGIGITPALINDAVINTYFAVPGAPTDDLSKFAWATHKTLPENPTSDKTAAVQGILGDLHTAIMSGSKSPDDAIDEAEDRFKNEVG
ncbi:multiple sugar transport system substrate-binding protein [Nocardioides terrae]|uniref:Multiple sugar transport system substrate-binding protein n=1 Tax=Nocardioides terrae TaxID=574651 RepID=A0A1I1ING0_9ACTN|nr:sugar ABC transporter substrate-binding protein [Nocardioides terrae]SFC34780.1 multiple sugar transport system substrate-binding protein [Nocardioides terrae]